METSWNMKNMICIWFHIDFLINVGYNSIYQKRYRNEDSIDYTDD